MAFFTNWFMPLLMGVVIGIILRGMGLDPLWTWVCVVVVIWTGIGATNLVAWNKNRKREAQAWREHQARETQAWRERQERSTSIENK